MSIGKLTEFNLRSGNWTMYVERAEMYFKVNSVKEELWLPTLIAAMGDEAYELLSNLSSPAKPSSKTYGDVVKMMREHLQPNPSFMAERYRFRQRRQAAGESILQYISELKKLSKFCQFNAVLEENLRDQLVCGLKSECIRQRLFAEEQLPYANAVKISCAMEAAERDAAAVERAPEGEGAALHAVAAGRARPTPVQRNRGTGGPRQEGRMLGPDDSKSKCYACGARDHRSDSCRYRSFICGGCKQKGHLRRVCPSRFTRRQNEAPGNNMVAHVQAAEKTSEGKNSSPLSGEDEPPLSEDDDDWQVEEELHQLSLNSYKAI